MKASISKDQYLWFYFSPEDQEKMKISAGEPISIQRNSENPNVFLFTLFKEGDSLEEARFLRSVVGSTHIRAGVKLEKVGMERVSVQRARELLSPTLKTPRVDGENELWQVTLPDIFFSTVVKDHAANFTPVGKTTLKGKPSLESRLRTSVATINEMVMKGEASCKVDRKTGKLQVKAYVTIGD